MHVQFQDVSLSVPCPVHTLCVHHKCKQLPLVKDECAFAPCLLSSLPGGKRRVLSFWWKSSLTTTLQIFEILTHSWSPPGSCFVAIECTIWQTSHALHNSCGHETCPCTCTHTQTHKRTDLRTSQTYVYIDQVPGRPPLCTSCLPSYMRTLTCAFIHTHIHFSRRSSTWQTLLCTPCLRWPWTLQTLFGLARAKTTRYVLFMNKNRCQNSSVVKGLCQGQASC
jgi:hypothetical protein